jgi:predicted phosphodiesterase
MAKPKLAITADLHWGLPKCQPGNLALIHALRENPPDLLLVGGDQGADTHFTECLDALATIGCPIGLVAGNHDIWVRAEDSRGDSWRVFNQLLPEECRKRGFHNLDQGPWILPQFDLAIVGTMNWYDHSWAAEELANRFPKDTWRLEQMCFTRGRHNDRVYVRWPDGMTNHTVTSLLATQLANHLQFALENASQVVLMTHHPALPELGFPPSAREPEPDGTPMDHLLWEAFSGNSTVESLIRLHADRLSLVISGHTHRWRSGTLGKARLVNVGSDYPVKNLIRLDGLEGEMEVEQFGPE